MRSDIFGTRVRERRIAEGLSQEELAHKVGISRNYVSQIERGEATNLSWRLVERLSAVLGLQPAPQQESEATLAELPEGLAQFARETNIPEDDVRMLARLQYRGRRPNTAEQWRLIYLAIKAATEPLEPPNEM